MRKYGIASMPNNSNAISSEVNGQFVTPQKTAIIPSAANMDGERCRIEPYRQPNVAPIKNEGTISPPLNPAAIVRTVNNSFIKNAYQTTFPESARIKIGIPAPK